jgi:antitoxin HicB
VEEEGVQFRAEEQNRALARNAFRHSGSIPPSRRSLIRGDEARRGSVAPSGLEPPWIHSHGSACGSTPGYYPTPLRGWEKRSKSRHGATNVCGCNTGRTFKRNVHPHSCRAPELSELYREKSAAACGEILKKHPPAQSTRKDNPMPDLYKVPLVLSPQPEGGYTVTSPVLPELITEGDTLEEAMANVEDALRAALEMCEDLGKTLPANLRQDAASDPIWFEYLVAG